MQYKRFIFHIKKYLFLIFTASTANSTNYTPFFEEGIVNYSNFNLSHKILSVLMVFGTMLGMVFLMRNNNIRAIKNSNFSNSINSNDSDLNTETEFETVKTAKKIIILNVLMILLTLFSSLIGVLGVFNL